uniref:Uncharacterized protein n=1 Tax=Tanacetum cinerariifolium TaxID=118510 RepID=A0A6L2NFT3_TANCI|nr:hypothetical protein [Tanacetum cinerariifolium]
MTNLSHYGSDALAEDHSTKQALGFQSPLYLKKAQQLEPKLYDGNVIKNTCAIVIPDSEETIMLAEESHLKMLLKQQDLMVLEKKVSTTPVDYANSMNSSDHSPSCRPTKVEVPNELSKVSMVNTSLKKLKHHLASFDVVVKERTTATATTEGLWGFEHTKACFMEEILPFVKALKDIFNTFDQYLINELTEVQNVFHQIEQVVKQHHLELKTFEIKMNQVLNENERLLEQFINKDIMNIVVNSSVDNTSVYMHECKKCLELETELLNKKDFIEKKTYDKLFRSYTTLEKYCISLEADTQLNQEIFQRDNSVSNQRVKQSTSTSGSQPSSNTKKDKIQRPPSSTQKNKVEAHPRFVKSSLKNKNCAVEPKGIAIVQHSKLNANSELICVKCNGCMLSDNHDLCVANYLDSGSSKHMTGDRSQLTNFVNKFLGTIKFRNDHVAKIMGYGDYHIGNVMISRVYYVEGLGHNLFSVGKKKPHKPKSEDTNQEKLYLLYMDLCGPIRVASVNGKKYILGIVDDYSRFTSTKTKTQSPVISYDVEEGNHDLDVAHMNNDSFFGISILENDSESSSSDVIPSVVHIIAPNSKHIEAMQEELNEFERLKVWELIPHPDNVMVITLKWIYKVKLDELGGILKNKARLVARGYRKEEGIDFEESFALEFSKGTVDPTLFIKRQGKDILLISQSPRGILLNQSKYALESLRKYGMESSDPVDTPMVEKSKVDDDIQGKAIDPAHYRGMAKPTEKHLHAVKRIFKYLRGTVNRGLWYPNDSSIALTGYVDTHHAGFKDTRRSTSRSMQLLGERLLTDYGLGFNKNPMYCDNKSAIALCCNNVQHSRSKHIDIRFHFIKEQRKAKTTSYERLQGRPTAATKDHMIYHMMFLYLSQNQRDLPRDIPLDSVEVLSMGKGLLGPYGGSGGLIEGRFGESCGGNGGSMTEVREGKVDSMGGMGGGSLAICSMVSNDGRGVGAGGGEVNGGGVDLGVSKRLLLEVAGEMIGESGGIEVREVDGDANT